MCDPPVVAGDRHLLRSFSALPVPGMSLRTDEPTRRNQQNSKCPESHVPIHDEWSTS
jgi:hypothetical protein